MSKRVTLLSCRNCPCRLVLGRECPERLLLPFRGWGDAGRPLGRRRYPDRTTTLGVVRRDVAPTRTVVADPTGARPGTITVDTQNRYLYLSMTNGSAVRYDVGVGREGFTWSGQAHIGRKAVWPGWTPPAAMLKRRPDLPRHMEGGIDNPLGARAMYLYGAQGDLMYRIHGSNEPDTIGQAVSSGCIRMLNEDVVDLYNRVGVGTKVVVL